MYNFKGKVAIVTGAAAKQGMGRGIAVALARGGADVAVFDKFEAPPSLYAGDEGWHGLSDVAKEIMSLGRKALAVKADVSNSKEVNDAVQKTLNTLDRIDILVNCAGLVGKRDTRVVDMTDEDWRFTIDVNLTGSFFISRAVARHMIKRSGGGKIVHFSSMQGKVGGATVAHYAASKFGVIGLVQSLALELAPYKINVNAICPGYIITNIRDAWLKDQAAAAGISVDEMRTKRYDEKASTVPLGRSGTVEDIVNLTLFLVSDKSDYMTGQAVNLTGGVTMY